ncbi:hypothetical protein BGZ63DRAFT_366017, partial [Mariannaea sp. PMI_226]
MGNAVLDQVFAGSTSPDIAARCIDIYRYIVNNFTIRHEIWMFGLGRGAYVVRCVAGMIKNYGILKKMGDDHETAALVNYIYSMYENLGHDYRPSSPQMASFRSRASWDVAKPVKFMGILDTTDPSSLPRLLSMAVSKYPPVDSLNSSSAVEHVYHAISIHERLPLFDFCSILPMTDETKEQVLPSLNEKWFPGTHHDLGRQNFPSTLVGRIIGGLIAWLFWLPWLPWPRGRPNTVLSDLVLVWMLESIQKIENSSGTLISGTGDQIKVVAQRLTSGRQSKGSGDVYVKMQPLEYLITSWFRFLRLPVPDIRQGKIRAESWTPWLRERRIFDLKATVYDYKRPFDQSGLAVWSLAEISKERYPSSTYEVFQ